MYSRFQSKERVMRTVRSIGRVLSGGGAGEGVERAVSWYDADYSKNPHYRVPYHESRYYPVWTVIVDRVRRAGSQRVLEVGCGSGQLASYLIEQGRVASYTGVDFSPRAIGIARQLAPDGTFIVADALDPRTYQRECDCIICTEVLEHIAEDLQVLSLFPSGMRCLCTVPDFPYPSHVRHFSSSEATVDRYGSRFADLDVTVFKAAGHRRNPVLRYFLMDGVRV
jgi:SAM-dependent methyltransferase